jgi:hypothetical protein
MRSAVSIFWVVILAVALLLPGVVGCSQGDSPTNPGNQDPPAEEPQLGNASGKAPADQEPPLYGDQGSGGMSK